MLVLDRINEGVSVCMLGGVSPDFIDENRMFSPD